MRRSAVLVRATRGVVLTGLLAASSTLPACRRAPPPSETVRPVRVMRVADFEGMSDRSFPGRAAATREVDLAFRVSGPLIARPVKVGSVVPEGELIASIDPRDFEVNLRNVRAQLMEAQAALALAEEQHERGRVAFERQAATEIEVTRMREAENKARASVEALAASVAAAEDALDDTELTAPFAGTIVSTYVENFQNVRADQMIVRLLDKSRIEFEISIPETLISMVPFVRDLRVTFDAFPDIELPARVNEVGNEASATTRTFPVTLIMDQPEGAEILPGMAGRASGTARPPRDEGQVTVVIPVSAVFSPAAGTSYVWVLDESTDSVRRRDVTLGAITSGGYVVDSGLEPGELIATAGVHFLAEGQRVTPQVQ
ncbi:MAG: efflux RND transporter periplasmic adaptor subunit [Planctomycetota bacterium]|jgi:RND family efflux transporter MFP subunit